MSFDPNDIGLKNGNLFGFPYSEEEADLIIIPVPWDTTASFVKGTAEGPGAILEASSQLDFCHPAVDKAWEKKVYMSPISEEWLKLNHSYAEKVEKYIWFLEDGGKLTADSKHLEIVNQVNDAQEFLRVNLKEKALEYLNKGKMVGVLGGEHSVPLGLMEALLEKYQEFGILQIDAHADLREAYEGFEQSHASIMYNVLKHDGIKKLVQVGVRDFSNGEKQVMDRDDRIHTFFNWNLKEAQFNGVSWKEQCDQIIEKLPPLVYVSFDIDGLKPSLCPDTGTPVPGGLEFEEAMYLIRQIKQSGREVIGFDLCEVAPGNNTVNAITGAHVLWNLCLL